MDKRFPVWMHLRLDSEASINKIVATIQRMFTNKVHPLTMDAFSTDQTFEAYMRVWALKNEQLGVMLSAETNGSDDDDDTGDPEDGLPYTELQEPEESTRGYATITHDLEAAGHYAVFLGRSAEFSRTFISILGRITKYLQQATVSLSIQDNANALHLVTTVRATLRERQPKINERLIRWLYFGNMAECRRSLAHFGKHELQPYIELCLRYFFMPMNIGRVKLLRMTLRPLPEGLANLYDKPARIALFADPELRTDVPDMLFVNGDHLTHVSMVYMASDKSKTNGKLVQRDVGQTLSVYIFFFFKYCRGNMNTVTNRKQRIGDSWPLFGGDKGGTWKYLLSNVRSYGRNIGLKVETMGLTRQTSSYMHQSRVAWVASRATDPNRIATDAASTKMGFASDHTQYTGLQSLRDTQNARDRLNGDHEYTKRTASLHPTLTPLPLDLHPLLLEMQSKTGINPTFVPHETSFVDTPWEDVALDESLFSSEYIASIHINKDTQKRRSVKEFISDEKKGVTRNGIDQTIVYHLRPRTLKLPETAKKRKKIRKKKL